MGPEDTVCYAPSLEDMSKKQKSKSFLLSVNAGSSVQSNMSVESQLYGINVMFATEQKGNLGGL